MTDERGILMKLTIGHLYPDLLNLYGDRGNIQCLRKRLEWRGIEVKVIPFCLGASVDFRRLDIVMLGGGSDREQELAADGLREARQEMHKFIEDGGGVLAVCGGYQLLGEYYRTSDKTIQGMGVLDIYTEWKQERIVGNVMLGSTLFSTKIVGFVNHGGRTHIGDYTPLGAVKFGFGNTEYSRQEGLVYKNVIATYLHGPLLPKNPEVCDWLIEKAMQRKYGSSVRLEPLPDVEEKRAKESLSMMF